MNEVLLDKAYSELFIVEEKLSDKKNQDPYPLPPSPPVYVCIECGKLVGELFSVMYSMCQCVIGPSKSRL